MAIYSWILHYSYVEKWTQKTADVYGLTILKLEQLVESVTLSPDYNSTKSGVDICDQMAKKYTLVAVDFGLPDACYIYFLNLLNVTAITVLTIFNIT